MRNILLLVALTVILLGGALYYRLGAYKDVTLEVSQQGPFFLIYKKHTGPYHKIVPVIEEVERWARANNEPCIESFGEYIDDPEKADEDRLQSHGGCLTTQLWTAALPEGFQAREIPAGSYLVGTFEGAPSLGPLKVYPKAKTWFRDNKKEILGPVIEIYRITNQDTAYTRYLFPITNQ